MSPKSSRKPGRGRQCCREGGREKPSENPHPSELFDFGCVLSKEIKESTNIVEERFLGVFSIFLVQCLLKNAHPGRHQQSEGQHGNAWEDEAAAVTKKNKEFSKS